ncbi:hypothetical protein [Chondromyces apiculatus]|uniref:Glycoprotein gp2 n=1 Tax=Chondromyces apiculatus DSM 436 TaxID=1192034 RepID=A0A017TCM7_9BACT|nr:hypothetical protein [Chondromyces apiculatus]EYF06535.1 Glycoprotein gp2 [Chondromyces apiculatus DSM 436]
MATVLPFALALVRAASAGQWRDDLPAVRDLGLVAVGVGGGLSTAVTQALALVPLGPRTFRAALGSALALGVSARLLYGMVRDLLLAAAHRAPAGSWLSRLGLAGGALPSPRLSSLLAAIATLTAALSPTWQREGTVGGGAMLATAGALGVVRIAQRCLAREPMDARGRGRADVQRARWWIALGALLGATVAESPMAGLAALGAALAMSAAVPGVLWGGPQKAGRQGEGRQGVWPSAKVLRGAVLAAIGVAVLLLAPLALRPLAPRAWADLGRALSTERMAALDVASAHTGALSAWVREVGVVSLLIAVGGALLAVARAPARHLVAPFLALLVLDSLLPARAAGVLSADPLTAVRSLAVAGIAAGSAVGVQEAARALLHARVPLAKSAAVLVVMFHVTLVALTSEEAGFAADRSEQTSAEVWADEALGSLEPRAAILVRSPAVAWRLWAARLTRGERPDVVVIPVPLLNRGRVALNLLLQEPALEPLLRDFALSGEPSELGLSTLADVRPLHVELDRRWSRRLLSHLSVDGLWLEFAPEPLGPSDRKLAAAESVVPLRRTLAALSEATMPDASTSAVLAETLRGHSSVIGMLGERLVAQTFLDTTRQLTAQDPFVVGGPIRLALTGVRQASVARKPVLGRGAARRR